MSVQNLNSFGEWVESLSIGRSEGVVMGGMSWFCGEGGVLGASVVSSAAGVRWVADGGVEMVEGAHACKLEYAD